MCISPRSLSQGGHVITTIGLEFGTGLRSFSRKEKISCGAGSKFQQKLEKYFGKNTLPPPQCTRFKFIVGKYFFQNRLPICPSRTQNPCLLISPYKTTPLFLISHPIKYCFSHSFDVFARDTMSTFTIDGLFTSLPPRF